MSDQEKFLSRWSRRKLEPADEKVPSEPPQAADAPAASADAAKPAAASPARQGEAAPIAGIRPQQAALARFDRRRFRHQGLPAIGRAIGAQACGAAARLVGRSGDPQLHWAGRIRLGFHRSQGNAGFRRPRSRASTSRSWSPRSSAMPDRTSNRARMRQVPRRRRSNPRRWRMPIWPRPRPPQANQRRRARNTARLQIAESLLQRDENVATQHDDRQKHAAATSARRHGGGNAAVICNIIPRLLA